MADITISGVITKCLAVKQGTSQSTGKPWMKAAYLIEHEHGQYPKSMRFDVMGEDRIKEFALREGEVVTVHININAHEYEGNWYNSIDAWKVEREQQTAQVQQPIQQPFAQGGVIYPEGVQNNSPF